MTTQENPNLANGNSLPHSFELDADPLTQPRIRFTLSTRKESRGNTVFTQFRCDEFHNRRLEEILAARIDPMLKTKSDILQDAVFLWLLEWDSRHPDGANGILRAQSAMRQMQMERQIRSDFLSEAKQQLEDLTEDGDLRRLEDLLQQLRYVQEDSKRLAPPSYMAELEKLIIQTQRLIEVNQ